MLWAGSSCSAAADRISLPIVLRSRATELSVVDCGGGGLDQPPDCLTSLATELSRAGASETVGSFVKNGCRSLNFLKLPKAREWKAATHL